MNNVLNTWNIGVSKWSDSIEISLKFKSHSSIKTSIGASPNCSAIYVPYIFSFKKLTNRSNILGKTCI